MFYIFNIKCTVLLVFPCVYTVFSLQKHVLLVHFTCLYQNKHEPYILHEMHSFASVFMCFYYVFTEKTCAFGKFHMYTKIHMYHIFYMKCTVLLVFSCVYTVFSLQKHVLLEHVTCIYQNTHVSYILHEIPSFADIFMCFHCVFTVETCTFGTFHMNTKIHMYHIFYMKCTVLLVFSCVFTVFSLQKHVLLVHFTCITKYTCTIYST
jgi:hypothetical protein